MDPQNQNPIPPAQNQQPQPTFSGPISYSSQQRAQASYSPKRHFSVKIAITLTTFLLIAALISVGYLMWDKNAPKPVKPTFSMPSASTTNLTSYAVPGESVNGSPEFSTSFYKDAVIQRLNDLVYLTSTATDSTKSSIWVYKLKNEIPICDAGGTTFNVIVMADDAPGCYRNDRIIYTAQIARDGIKYQINLVSQKPIEVSEAKTILSSVTLK